MSERESYYPDLKKHEYTYTRIRNLSYVSHLHSTLEFIYVLSGNVRVTIDGANYNLRDGDIALVLPRQRHSYKTNAGSEVFGCAIRESACAFKEYFQPKRYTAIHPVIRHDAYPMELMRLVDFLLEDGVRRAGPAVHVGLLNALLGYILDCAKPVPGKSEEELSETDKLIEFVYQHMSEPLSLQKAASAMDISPSAFSKTFSRQIGMNFHAYLLHVRVASAKRRLAFTDAPMNDIAADCGFESLRTFNRVFREETGYTPRDFRAIHDASHTLDLRPVRPRTETE